MEENLNDQSNVIYSDLSEELPEHSKAVSSLVLGIIGLVFAFSGTVSLFSIIMGIIGLSFAKKAKIAGNVSKLQKTGYRLSLLAIIFGAVIFTTYILFIVIYLGDTFEYYNLYYYNFFN